MEVVGYSPHSGHTSDTPSREMAVGRLLRPGGHPVRRPDTAQPQPTASALAIPPRPIPGDPAHPHARSPCFIFPVFPSSVQHLFPEWHLRKAPGRVRLWRYSGGGGVPARGTGSKHSCDAQKPSPRELKLAETSELGPKSGLWAGGRDLAAESRSWSPKY